MKTLLILVVLFTFHSSIFCETQVQEQISLETLKTICQFFPVSFQSQCANFLNNNLKIHADIQLEMETSKEIPKRSWPSKRCRMCIKIVSYYERALNSSLSTEVVLQHFLDITDILKSPLKEKAKLFLKYEGPKIIPLILKNADPKIICQMEHLCSKSVDQAQFENKLTSSSESTNQCSICNLVSKALANFQNQKLTKEQSSKALETVCYFVQTSKTEECTKFVKKFENEISNFMINNIEINSLCNSLEVCKSDKKLSDSLFFLPMLKLN